MKTSQVLATLMVLLFFFSAKATADDKVQAEIEGYSFDSADSQPVNVNSKPSAMTSVSDEETISTSEYDSETPPEAPHKKIMSKKFEAARTKKLPMSAMSSTSNLTQHLPQRLQNIKADQLAMAMKRLDEKWTAVATQHKPTKSRPVYSVSDSTTTDENP